MTKRASLIEAGKSPRDEQHESVKALSNADEDDSGLTPEDIAVAEARWNYAEQHPETLMTREQAETHLRELTGR